MKLTGVLAADGGLVAQRVHEGAAVASSGGQVEVDGETSHGRAKTVVVVEL